MRTLLLPRLLARAAFAAVLVLLASAGAARGQVRVTASVDATTVREDDQVTLVVEVTGADADDVAVPSTPATQNLSAQTAFPAMSTQGVGAESRVAFSWAFRPLRPGAARIGEVVVRVGGVPYQADGFALRVVGATSGYVPPVPAPAPRLDPRADPRAGEPPRSRLDAGSVFVRSDVAPASVYVGEQVVATHRLFLRAPLGARLLDAGTADAPGFWREELLVDAGARPTPVALGRARYAAHVLARAALFPTRAGTLRLAPFKTSVRVALPPGTLPRFEDRPLASEPAAVTVRPLPPGAPAAFTGAVGRFALAAVLDGAGAAVGGAVRLRVEVTGDGNLALLPAPTLALPDSLFATYPPDVGVRIERGGGRLWGVKTFTYALVPRRAGRLAVPPVAFAYFDPRAGRYVRLAAGGGVVDVAEAPAETPEAAAPDSAAAEPAVGRPPDAPPEGLDPWPYALAAALALGGAVALGLAWRLRRRPAPAAEAQEAGTPPRAESGRPALPQPAPSSIAPSAIAARGAPRRSPFAPGAALAEAEAYFARGDAPAGHRALARAVDAALEHRLGRATAGLPRRALADALADAGLPAPLRARTLALLDRLDAARFAPAAPGPDAARADVDETRAVCDALGA